jgi:hypothetical protein
MASSSSPTKVLRIIKTPECERQTTQSSLSLLRHYTALCPPSWKRDFEREVVSVKDGYGITIAGLELLRMAGYWPDMDGVASSSEIKEFDEDLASLFDVKVGAETFPLALSPCEVLWSFVMYRGWPLPLRRAYGQDPAVYDVSYLVGAAWALLCSISRFFHVLQKPQTKYCQRKYLDAILEQGPPTWQRDVRATMTYQEGHLLITPQGLDLFLRILPLNLRRHLHVEPLDDSSQDLWQEERLGSGQIPVLTRVAYGPDEKLFSIPAMMDFLKEMPEMKEMFASTAMSRRLTRYVNKAMASASTGKGAFASSNLRRWIAMSPTRNLFDMPRPPGTSAQTVQNAEPVESVQNADSAFHPDRDANPTDRATATLAAMHTDKTERLDMSTESACSEELEKTIADANAHARELRQQRRRLGAQVDHQILGNGAREHDEGHRNNSGDEPTDAQDAHIKRAPKGETTEETRKSQRQRRKEDRQRQQEAAQRRREKERAEMEAQHLWRTCGAAFAATVTDKSVDSLICDETVQQIERDARQHLRTALRRRRSELRRERAPQKLKGAVVRQLFYDAQ